MQVHWTKWYVNMVLDIDSLGAKYLKTWNELYTKRKIFSYCEISNGVCQNVLILFKCKWVGHCKSHGRGISLQPWMVHGGRDGRIILSI